MELAENHIKPIHDGDVIILPSDCVELLHQCCDCGLWHLIEIQKQTDGKIHFTFTRLNHESPLVKKIAKIEIMKENF